jgi:hypothetical protein
MCPFLITIKIYLWTIFLQFYFGMDRKMKRSFRHTVCSLKYLFLNLIHFKKLNKSKLNQTFEKDVLKRVKPPISY